MKRELGALKEQLQVRLLSTHRDYFDAFVDMHVKESDQYA